MNSNLIRLIIVLAFSVILCLQRDGANWISYQLGINMSHPNGIYLLLIVINCAMLIAFSVQLVYQNGLSAVKKISAILVAIIIQTLFQLNIYSPKNEQLRCKQYIDGLERRAEGLLGLDEVRSYLLGTSITSDVVRFSREDRPFAIEKLVSSLPTEAHVAIRKYTNELFLSIDYGGGGGPYWGFWIGRREFRSPSTPMYDTRSASNGVVVFLSK